MPANFVQNNIMQVNPVTNATLAYSKNVTQGNLLLVYCWQGNDATDDTGSWTVTDTIGNTYTRFSHAADSTFAAGGATGSKHALFACIASNNGPNTVTIGFGASKLYARMAVWEYTGTPNALSLFEHDWEDNSTSTYTGNRAASNGTIQTTTKYQGSYALRANPTASEIQWYKTFTARSRIGVSFAVNRASAAAETPYFLNLYNSDFSSGLKVQLVGGLLCLRKSVGFTDTTIDNAGTMATNTWYFIEIKADFSTQKCYWRVNGAESVELGMTSVDSTVQEVDWGCFNYAMTFDCYLDALRVVNDYIYPSYGAICDSAADSVPHYSVPIPYFYQTTTTASDPGSGNMRLNNASLPSVTQMYFDSLDASTSTNRDAAFATFLGRGMLIRLVDNSNQAVNYAEYYVTNWVNNTGWWTATVYYIGQNGTLPQAGGSAWWACFAWLDDTVGPTVTTVPTGRLGAAMQNLEGSSGVVPGSYRAGTGMENFLISGPTDGYLATGDRAVNALSMAPTFGNLNFSGLSAAHTSGEHIGISWSVRPKTERIRFKWSQSK